MSTATTATSNLVSGLQVSGNRSYDGKDWREAILAFLGGVWSGDSAVTNRQKISFNNTTIRIGDNGKYYAYFTSAPDASPLPDVPRETSELLVITEPTQYNVESGLIRFVRNNHIRQLSLWFGGVSSEGTIVFTKGQKRSEIFISTYGLVSVADVMRRIGYSV